MKEEEKKRGNDSGLRTTITKKMGAPASTESEENTPVNPHEKGKGKWKDVAASGFRSTTRKTGVELVPDDESEKQDKPKEGPALRKAKRLLDDDKKEPMPELGKRLPKRRKVTDER
jgi:hypothetical protein